HMDVYPAMRSGITCSPLSAWAETPAYQHLESGSPSPCQQIMSDHQSFAAPSLVGTIPLRLITCCSLLQAFIAILAHSSFSLRKLASFPCSALPLDSSNVAPRH